MPFVLTSDSLAFSHSVSSSFSFPNMAVEKGEHHLILGKSGCGKTTLLHILSGILKPKTGIVKILEKDLYQLSERKRDAFRGQHIGIVFQQAHLIPSLTVYQNIAIAGYLSKNKVTDAEINALLLRLDMMDKKRHFPAQISQGEQQRIAIARALIHRPALIFADEPTSGLDDENCEQIIRLFMEETQHFDSTLLIVTHDNRLKSRFNHKILL